MQSSYSYTWNHQRHDLQLHLGVKTIPIFKKKIKHVVNLAKIKLLTCKIFISFYSRYKLLHGSVSLSKMAADKLLFNNPAIADLNDQNRPTKLAEMYGELYDNEWTNAFEALTQNGYSDIESIDTLRTTLLVYLFLNI